MKPRCGKPMLRYKPAPGDPEGMTSCGRPEGHNGECRSKETCARYAAADVQRIAASRRAAKMRGEAYGRGTGPRAVTAGDGTEAPAGKPSACGTYLSWLLHQARGEEPCPACDRAAGERLAEQAKRNRELLGAELREWYRERRAAA